MKKFHAPNRLFVFAFLLSLISFSSKAQCPSTVSTFPYTQGFESGVDDWVDDTTDDFDWTNQTGGTPSNNTGPSGAQEGSFYMYTEASDPNNPSKIASLESPCYDFAANTSPSISFFYHMYENVTGNTGMGTLFLEIDTNTGIVNPWTTLWSKSGDQGDVWHKDSVDLSAYAGMTIKLRFRGLTGTGAFNVRFAGDRAIDNIKVSNGMDITNVSCNGGTDGTATAYTLFGSAPYTYSWSTGDTTQTITGLSAGTYTVTITDNLAATEVVTNTVVEPAIPTPGGISVSISSFCSTAPVSVDLSITPPTGDSVYFSQLAQQTSTSAGNTPGGTLHFTFNNTPTTVTSDGTLTVFFRGDLDSPGEEIQYFSENGALIGQSGNTAQCGGTFASQTFTISQDSLIAWTANDSINIDADALDAVGVACGGFSHIGYMTLQYEYTPFKTYWFTDSCSNNIGNAFDSSFASVTVNPLTTTTYFVRYYDAACNTYSSCDSVTITVHPQPTVSVSPSAPTLCAGSSVVLTASGASTYSWSPSTGLSGVTGSVVTANPTSTTTYTVIGTDGNGCLDTATVTVTVAAGPTSSIAGTTDVTCNGGNDGTATASASGGLLPYTYNWSNGGSIITITGLAAGSYTVTVTDQNGCTSTSIATVNEPTALSLTTTSTNVNCFGDNTGTATAIVSGGTIPYTYAWSNGQISSTSFALTAATYTVTVTDQNGCTATGSETVTQPGSALSTTITVTSNISCVGGTNGSLTANASGGTTPYTYAWPGGQTTATATGLSAGTYEVTVTDGNGCTDQESGTLSNPSNITVVIFAHTDVSCFGGNDGTASAFAFGGTGALTYAWPSGETTASATMLSAGLNCLTVTDANGCTATACETLTEPPTVTIAETVTNVSCFGGNDGSISVSVSGGTSPYTYSWPSGGTGTTESGLTAGTYTITVTDNNACTYTEAISVTEPTELIATLTATNVSCNGANDGQISSASTSGGTGAYTYAWSNGSTSSSISGLSPGTYTLTVTDANGCTDDASTTITEPAPLVASTAVDNNVSCNGGSDGQATASGAGGTTAYTFSWSNGSNSATATGLAAGTHTVTLTDANGCIDTETVTITEPALLVASTSVVSDVTCNGGSDGQASASGTGGITAYTFNWSNGASGTSVTGLAAGTYTVTLTDANGCTDTETVTITEPSLLVASTTIDNNVSCNGLADGAATASATGGTTAYTFAWSTGATTASVTGLVAGTYTVTITDANGCADTETATITEPALLVASTAVDNDVSCNGGSDGEATASATGGTTAYTFAWSTGATSATITGLAAGTYTVTITDANGCTDDETVTITEPTVLSVSASVDNDVSCNGGSDGQATASGAGGTTAYTFSWSNGSNSATATGLVAGTHTVTLTDANGCTDTESVTITEPTLLVAATSVVNDVSCNGGSDGQASASGTGGTTAYTFNWSNGASGTPVTGLAAGTYTVTLTDANGCTDTETVTISEPNAVVATTAIDSNVSCNGLSDGGATVSVTGGTTAYTYAWSTGATTTSVTGLSAGTYTVTVTDANGCTATSVVSITQPNELSITASSVYDESFTSGTTYCPGSSNYDNWVTFRSSLDPLNITYQSVSMSGTSLPGGITCSDPAIVTQIATALKNGTELSISCSGTTWRVGTGCTTGCGIPGEDVELNANNSGADCACAAGPIVRPCIGNANWGGLGSQSCAAATQTIRVEFVGSAIIPQHVSCNGGNDGSATATAVGGTTPYTFNWNTGGTTATITGLTAGTYTLTVTDANGCTDSDTVSITEPGVLVAATSVDNNVSCNGGTDGQASASGTGGTTSYTFNWSNGASGSPITGLAAGTYTVTLTDANGCTDTETVTITEPSALSVSIPISTNVSCNGGNDGTASATASGGTTAYTFNWSNGSSGSSITGLAAGTYTVTVTDANGCTDDASVVITEPAVLVASTTIDNNVSCNGLSDGAATASATGGTTAYTFAWSTGATTASITGLAAGTYTVTITDANSCTDTETATISEPAAIVASTVVDNDVSCNGGSDGGATASATGGTTAYTFAWNTGATSATITGLAAGTYTVTITDANGCTDDETVSITEPTVLSVATTVDNNVSCNGGNDGQASASGTGGTTAYTFNWSNGASGTPVTGLAAGTYTVTITDANGCTDTETVTITEPTPVLASTVVDSNVSCNGGSDGGATASATGGTGAYTFAWSNGATTASITGITAGTYTVTVTDANGCTDDETVIITEPTVLTAATVVDSNVSCNGGSDGGATASGTGGTAPYTYAWSTGATTASITGLAAGTYTITLTDANGCTDDETVIITEPTVLTAAMVVDSNVSCNGGSDGGATASGTGGTAPYTYAWSNGATTASITGLAAGTYTVTLTDANGCTDDETVTITEPTVLTASTAVDNNVSCNGGNDGGATASGTGGTTPYTYAWSTGATTASITGLAAGTYTITLTDANGCTDDEVVTITEPTALSLTTVVDNNVSCNGGSDGGATANVTGGTTAYTYAWSNGATTASVTGLAAGTYSVTVTDANGCTDDGTVTITEPTVLVAATAVISNVSCNGLLDGEASAIGIGGTTPYTFNWSNGASGSNVTGLAAGTYTVTITDANGCTDDETVTIIEPALLVATTVVDSNVSCNGGSDGGATVSATGGTTPYTYAWSTGATTASVTGLAAGTYSVTVTDNNGCTDSGSVVITEPTFLLAFTSVNNNVSCNGGSDGEANAIGTGGTTPYTFSWSNGASGTPVTGLSAGTYTVTLTDANGCTDTETVTITEPTPVLASTVVDSNVSCNGGSDGGATASATGGTGAYTFAWSNGATTASITGITAGTYTVTVTDANGCTDDETVIIIEPAALIAATVVDSNVSCNGGSDGGATASGTGGTAPYTYAWSNGATTASITGLAAGTYTITLTDANGCTDDETVIITEPTVLTAATVVDSNVSCNGGSDGGATVSGTGGTTPYTYAWSNGATTASITGLAAGTYTVTLTDANGCTDDETVTITEPTLLTASTTVDNNVNCNGGSTGQATASGTGGTTAYTFNWSNGASGATASSLAAGTYTVTLTDANGCTDTETVTITEPTPVLASTVVDSNVSCNGGSDGGATASATGGTGAYTFAWSNGATTASITGITAGTYTVTVTDANGCTDDETVIITEPTVLTAATVVDSNVSCNGGSDGGATASGTGGTAPYTYAWSTGATTASITGLAAGTYTITLTDANGCTDDETVIITEPTVLTAAMVVDSNVSCNGGSDGGATASGTGGTAPYTYAWSNGATTASVTGLAAGTYTVTLTDANGCTDDETVTITEPTVLTAATVVDSNVSCNGGSDGGATASGTGGTAPYTYAWSTGATTASITGITAGTYTVTVTDANGCTDDETVTITEPTPVLASTVVDSNVSCNGGSDGGATASATGGTGAYTFAWSNGATTASITGITAGTYTVTVTDANGCTDDETVIITEPTVLTAATVVDSNVSCNGGSDGGATASGTGGTAPYTYAWSTGATTASITGITAGTYTVTVTDANGCTDDETVIITEPTVLTAATVVDSNVSCNGGSDGGATASGIGGTAPYTYAWSTGATTASITGLAAGTYTITLTDANGCTDDETVTITEPTLLTAATAVDNNVSCNGGNDGGATASGTGGTTPYTFNWSNGASGTPVTGLSAGTYTVTLTDANGCTDTETVTITEPTPVLASTVVDSNVSCNGGSDGGATASATGGTGAYTFAWSNGATTASITGITAGTYTVTVTDANGCTDDETVIIIEPAALIAATVVDSNVSCNGGSDGGATASGTGGTAPYTYAWSTGATTASITGLAASTYTITLTDANGCTDDETVIITEPTVLTAATVVDSNVSCNGGSDGGATASGTGGTAPYTYAWSTGATTASITGLAAGTYTITLTDANGCTDDETVTITEPTLLTAATAVDNNVSCNGGNDGGATASGTGGTTPYTYAWSTGATTASITGLSAGTYTVTLTDANGCTDTETVTITEPTPVLASTVVDSNVSCNGGSDGGATASATGGTGAYTFAWSNGATTASITGITAGTYTVTVTDANGCTDDETVIITEPTVLTAATVVDSNVSCNGGSDGGATASGTGGTAPYTYAWSTGATTASITGLAAGTYTITLTDANGCTDDETVIITEPTVLTAATVVDSNVSCNGGSDGGATASGTGGTTPYTYAWSTGATTASITGLSAGTYTVTLTDANGCTDDETVIITEPTILNVTISVNNDVFCAGDSTGSATASGAGGTTPYTFNWSTGESGATEGTLLAGTHTVTITDANGCTNTASVTISEPPVLDVTIAINNNVLCNGDSTGSATASGAGGTTPYTFNWSTGESGATEGTLLAGTHTVTITDANGCTDTASVTITEPGVLVAITTIDSNVSCNGLSDGGATALGTGGTTPYTYAWSNGATTASITGIAVGTYTVTITDANGCTDDEIVVITEPVVLDVSIALNNHVLCNGDSTGSATGTGSGGTTPYTYDWSTGESGATEGTLLAGTHTVTITDANGCTDTASITITEPLALAVSAVVNNNVFCFGDSTGSATASGSGGITPYTFNWSTGESGAIEGTLLAGTHTVTITDANGCTSTTSVTITEPPTAVDVSVVSIIDATCVGGNDGEATVNASGGVSPYIYLWPGGQTTATVTGLTTGTYVVTATDANGCTDTISLTINGINPQPVVDLGNDTAICNGTFTTLDAGAGLAGYNWSTGDTTQTIDVLSSGAYTVTVTDNVGCTNSDTANISINPGVVITLVTSQATCGASDGSALAVIVSGGGGYQYNWSNGATTPLASGLFFGDYIVTVTDTNGCFTTDTASITNVGAATLTAVTTDLSCAGANDGTATAILTGGTAPFAYSWSSGDTTDTIINIAAGVYQLTVSDSNLCLSTISMTVSEPPAIIANVGAINSQCGDSTGIAYVDASGGMGLLAYQWDDFNLQTTDTAFNIPAGLYSVVVTDTSGCSVTELIGVNDAGSASLLMSGVDVLCEGDSNGLAIVSATGVSPFTYLWNDGAAQTTDTASNLADGAYFVVVTDSNGCVSVDSVQVGTMHGLPLVNIGDFHESCEGSTVTLDAGPGFTYVWNDLSTGQTLDVDTSGTYGVIVTDTNSCSNNDTTAVIFYPNPTTNLGPDTLICINDNPGITYTLDAGVGFSNYEWQDGSGNQTFIADTTGLYFVTVESVNGCFGSDTVALVFDLCQGISSVERSVEVKYYPNPTDGLINMEVEGLDGEDIEIRVVNMQGVMILSEKVTNLPGSYRNQLDLSEQAQGIYFIQVLTNGQSYTSRISVK